MFILSLIHTNSSYSQHVVHQLHRNTTGAVYDCTALICVWEVTKVGGGDWLLFLVLIYWLLLYFHYSCETLAVVWCADVTGWHCHVLLTQLQRRLLGGEKNSWSETWHEDLHRTRAFFFSHLLFSSDGQHHIYEKSNVKVVEILVQILNSNSQNETWLHKLQHIQQRLGSVSWQRYELKD